MQHQTVQIPTQKARAVLDGKAVSTGVRQIAGDGAVTATNPPSIENASSPKTKDGIKRY